MSMAKLCYYCGFPVHNRGTKDHIIPLVRLKTHQTGNIVICCEYCNVKKGDLTETQYRELLQNSDWTFNQMFVTTFKLYMANLTLSSLRYEKANPREKTMLDIIIPPKWHEERSIDKMIRRLTIRVASRTFFRKRAIEIHEGTKKS